MKLRHGVSVALTVVHWTLLGVTLFYLLTGFGITQFRIVQTITFGLLTKPLAFTLHDILWIPFLVLLAMHLVLALWGRRLKRNCSAVSGSDPFKCE
ncbi:MAG: hypothetical protein NTU59_01275 [Coprothermobacterota bacterium]|nr:hypothetical protein [Coprothermobacterota bacterium]